MSFGDLLLLLAASLGHATWNAISRTITRDRDRFYTVIMLIGLVIYGPFAVATIVRVRHVGDVVGWVFGAAFFEMAYFFCLAKAYERNSFLSAYPIARGSSPLITALLSAIITGTLVSFTAMVGIGLVAIGIFSINLTSLSRAELRYRFGNRSALWALLTGFCTASYTICYAQSVTRIPTLLLLSIVMTMVVLGRVITDWVSTGLRPVAPSVARQENRIVGDTSNSNWAVVPAPSEPLSYLAMVQAHPIPAIAGGVLMFGVTAIVVYTMHSVNVALVAAVREFSIVFATVIGAFWLKESLSWHKAVAISLIILGVLLVAV